ncbi:ground-like domain-containing protein [Ditylenchus destructor]|nr:ground-like domain-containing protein [Ditylenchus destructor]
MISSKVSPQSNAWKFHLFICTVLNLIETTREHGYPVPAAPVPVPVAPAPVPAPAYAAAPAFAPAFAPAPASGTFGGGYQPQALPPAVSWTYPPATEPPPRQSDPYPLRECYTDDSNYMCCNSQLESLMKLSYQQLHDSGQVYGGGSVSTQITRHGEVAQITGQTAKDSAPDGDVDMQALGDRLQENLEANFNTTFEVVVGRGDYASKSRFYEDLICKIRRGCNRGSRFILAYATPKPPLECADPYRAWKMPGPLRANGFFSSQHNVYAWKT